MIMLADQARQKLEASLHVESCDGCSEYAEAHHEYCVCVLCDNACRKADAHTATRSRFNACRDCFENRAERNEQLLEFLILFKRVPLDYDHGRI